MSRERTVESNDWIRDHGLLVAIIGIVYLIVRDVMGTLLRRLNKTPEQDTSVLGQKADHAIYLAERNSQRIDELLDAVARLVRQREK